MLCCCLLTTSASENGLRDSCLLSLPAWIPISFQQHMKEVSTYAEAGLQYLGTWRSSPGIRGLEDLFLVFVLSFSVSERSRLVREQHASILRNAIPGWWLSSFVLKRARSTLRAAHIEQKRRITSFYLQTFYDNEVLFIYVGIFSPSGGIHQRNHRR